MKRGNLKAFREERHLSQKQMADKLHISKSHYVNIERGVFDPSYELLKIFSEQFNCNDTWRIFKPEEAKP